MSATLAVAAALLAACGAYLVTADRLSRVVIGVGLLGHAANVVLFLSGGRGGAPAFDGDRGPFGDPLPQAMVLTAIVISLAVIALLLAIAYRSWLLDGDDPVEGAVEGAAERAPADPGSEP